MNKQDSFNRYNKIGQAVWLEDDLGRLTKTYLTSPAWALPSGDVVAKVEGRTGCFDVDRITPRDGDN